MGDTVLIETTADEVVSIVTAGPQGPSGAEAATLTTTGDLLYRDALANDRLPIGSEGQVLKVSSGLPAWGNESGAVTSVNGETGAVVLDAADVGAQSQLERSSVVVSADAVLSSNRNQQINLVVYGNVVANVTLPYENIQNGDLLTITTEFFGSPSITLRRAITTNPLSYETIQILQTSGAKYQFIVNTATWVALTVTTHTHPASDITSGTLTHERGGLEADVSAYDGLLKISGGSTSAVTVTTAGEALLDDADAAAQRTTLGLGNSATLDTGTTAGTVAEGNHTHTQLHDRSHAITSTSDHTAGNHKVFYSNGSGEIVELALGNSGEVLTSNGASAAPSFAAASGGGVTTGSVDNAILRADGTGGSTSQGSALVLSDFSNSTQETVAISGVVAGFSCTADAATDVFTAVGHNFVANQQVAFTSLTGGSGVDTTRPYYVRDISGDTFKLSFGRGTGALGISTDITASTIVSSVGLVLSPQSFGGIMTAIPDGTSANGNARGYDAVDLCNYRTAATAVASGIQSALLGGASNTASGTGAVVIGGTSSIASHTASFVGGGRQAIVSGTDAASIGGNQNTASATGAITLGGFQNQAAADNALAFGRGALANRFSLMAHGNIPFAAIGDSQRIRAVLRCKTTTNAAVEMALNGTTTYLTIPSGKVIFCNIKVVGVKSDGSAVATYERQYAAKNVAGTSSEVYAAVTIGTDNAASTSLAISTQDAGDYISIQPTGIASETWRWVASVDAVEVAYGS